MKKQIIKDNIIGKISISAMILLMLISCSTSTSETSKNDKKSMIELSAREILGNPDYPAISYGGYRTESRDSQPTIDELKRDMRILSAMGIRIVRTYNTHFAQASNLLEAIHQLNEEDTGFEMGVMLGAWIDCKDAFTASPNHEGENSEENAAEIQRAVDLTHQYPEIVKIIAVGNEAMVKWATEYFVQPNVILKYVNHLQTLKAEGKLPKELWVTSSDNFASWGGGGSEYHTEDLAELIKSVDYISLHTYPMHDTHYNPEFWGVEEKHGALGKKEKIAEAMKAASNYAVSQYNAVAAYAEGLAIEKPMHIGETGWASSSNGLFSSTGSKACDEYKEKLYYEYIRKWGVNEGVSVFYFEAFDEKWKDAENPGGSENHFGLFTIDGKAKYVMWELVDQGVFDGLSRNGNPITKTYNGDEAALMKDVLVPPLKLSLTNSSN